MSARGAGPAWMRGFDALRRRAAGLGQREHSGELDAFGFDPEALRIAQRLLTLTRAPWWRSSTQGQDTLQTLFAPAADAARDARAHAPPIFVVQPGAPVWSGLLVAERVAQVLARGARDGDAATPAARPRFLVAHEWSARPFWQPVLARLGGVGACRANLEHLLDAGHAVVVSASARSTAQRPRPELCVETLARVALARGAPLVPVSAEVVGLVRGLRMMPAARTLFALDPLGYLPLRWRVTFGTPLETRATPRASENTGAARAMEDANASRVAEGAGVARAMESVDVSRATEDANPSRAAEGVGASRATKGAGVVRATESMDVDRVTEGVGTSRVAKDAGAVRMTESMDASRASEDANAVRVTEDDSAWRAAENVDVAAERLGEALRSALAPHAF